MIVQFLERRRFCEVSDDSAKSVQPAATRGLTRSETSGNISGGADIYIHDGGAAPRAPGRELAVSGTPMLGVANASGVAIMTLADREGYCRDGARDEVHDAGLVVGSGIVSAHRTRRPSGNVQCRREISYGESGAVGSSRGQTGERG
jgi:hypothetical protein